MLTQTQNRPQTEVKADIRKQFTLLREVCSKANNWHEIQPVIDKFDGSLQNLFESFGPTS